MRKYLLGRGMLFGLLLVMMCSFCGCVKVKEGERIVCKVGNHVIRENIQERDVPFWEASKHSIRTEYTYCESHGNEQVNYKITHLCKTCGKPVSEETAMAVRRTESQDQNIRDSEHPECAQQREASERRERIYQGARNASQKVGEFFGNVSKGLFDGANRGSR